MFMIEIFRFYEKLEFAKMTLNHLQEPRDIKITQCKHKVSHFIQIIFYT